jgi:hypothetical protein
MFQSLFELPHNTRSNKRIINMQRKKSTRTVSWNSPVRSHPMGSILNGMKEHGRKTMSPKTVLIQLQQNKH